MVPSPLFVYANSRKSLLSCKCVRVSVRLLSCQALPENLALSLVDPYNRTWDSTEASPIRMRQLLVPIQLSMIHFLQKLRDACSQLSWSCTMRLHKVRAMLWRHTHNVFSCTVISVLPHACCTITCCIFQVDFASCAGWNCHCRATLPGGVRAVPSTLSNSSDLATLQKFAKGIPNLNAALRNHNLMAWEDEGSFCNWGGVTCLANISQVWNLTLSNLQLEGALALERDGSRLAQWFSITQMAFLLAPRIEHFSANGTVWERLVKLSQEYTTFWAACSWSVCWRVGTSLEAGTDLAPVGVKLLWGPFACIARETCTVKVRTWSLGHPASDPQVSQEWKPRIKPIGLSAHYASSGCCF